MLNIKATERIAVAGVLSPATVANTETFTGVVDLAGYHQVMGIVALGNMAAETIDAVLYRCDSAGNNAVALKSATQLSAHATNNDNKQIVFNARSDDLIAAGAQYVKLGVVTGNSTGGAVCAVILGVDSRFGPVTQPAAVVQSV